MINDIIKLIRKFHGLKLIEMADMIGLSNSHLSLLENGGRNVSVDLLNIYSRTFGIDVSAMFYLLEHLDDSKMHEKVPGVFSAKSIHFFKWVHQSKIDNKPAP